MTAPPSVVGFGELLLRLDPPGELRLRQAGSFEARYTGAEANVVASLAGFGIPGRLCGAVPDDELGEACLAYLRRYDLDTSMVLRAPGRLGLFFAEAGGAGRPPRVVYDRAGSVYARTGADAYDWPAIFDGQGWLHVAGTAAAVGAPAAAAVGEAMRAARSLGLGVSLDVNYRAALWTQARAAQVLTPLLEHVTVLLGSGSDAATIFGSPTRPDGSDAGLVEEHLRQAEQLRARFDLALVAGTVRRRGSSGLLQLQGIAAGPSGTSVSREYPVLDGLGRIGTGDAFSAGILRGVLLAHDLERTVEFAAAAAHLKQSIAGDVNLVTVAEVEDAVLGRDPDRIAR